MSILETLENKLPTVAPLLVKLHNCDEFAELDADDKRRARANYAQIFSDILEQPVNFVEQEILSDILIGLIAQAERDLRCALSERLAVMENAPLRLVLHLANDKIEVATPVLRKSMMLTDIDLMYIIKARDASYWKEIATRPSLGESIVNELAFSGDVYTMVNLAKNEAITISAEALNAMTDKAREHEELATPLLQREDVPELVARKLYEYVGAELRDYIRAHYGVFSGMAAAQVDDLIIEFAEAQRPQEQARDRAQFMPTMAMVSAAERYKKLGMLNVKTMMETLRRGQIASFIALFSSYTGLKARNVHNVLQTSCPKGMVLACRAFGFQKSEFSLIYMMTNRMRSSERIINQKDLMEMLTYFDRVRPEVARRIVSQRSKPVRF